MPFEFALRAAGRWLSLLAQSSRDLKYHARFTGTEFSPRLQRIIEQARLLACSAIDAEDYYRLGLYRPEMRFDDKAAFIGKFANYRYYDLINPPQYDVLGLDKALMHRLAASLSIPMPEVLATTGPLDAPSYGPLLDTPAKVRDFLAQPDSEDLFLKPVTGSLGAGALSLGQRVPGTQTWRTLPGKDSKDAEGVLAWISSTEGQLERFLIQRRVIPHPVIHDIAPDVLATIRFGTLTRKGVTSIVGWSLRLGGGQTPTDNYTEPGGITVAIDMTTGTLGDAVEIVDGRPRVRQDHPRTRKRVTGIVIPDWQDYVATALDAAGKFSFMPWLAWDVGVSAQGPVITEFNTRTRWTSTQQAMDKGLLSGEIGATLLPHRGMGRSGLLFPARIVREHAASPSTRS